MAIKLNGVKISDKDKVTAEELKAARDKIVKKQNDKWNKSLKK